MRLSLAAMDFTDALFISDSGDDTGGARHISIPPLASREAYSRFVIKELLDHIETDHVLLIQWDGYVVNSGAWRDEFLAYDYIGARWGFHDDAHNVGNGGFSFRSRRLLEALRSQEIDQFEPEDEKICRHYRPFLEEKYGIRFAPAEIADYFSFETTYPKGRPLGFHGLFNMWLFLADEEMTQFVAALPRQILGSPQALSLAKNLIELKRVDSARILLEARLKSFPADNRCAAMLAGLNKPAAKPGDNIGRNDPCPCGSGKRFKHCCGQKSIDPTAPADSGQSTSQAATALLRQAMVDHQAGRLARARQGYSALRALGPDAMAEHYLGVLDMQEGRPGEGEARIRAALAMRDDVPDFHNNLGLCLRAQSRFAEAVAAYRRALDLNPCHAPAWSNLGLDLHKLGRYTDAVDAFNRALALEPNLAQAHFSRALVLLTQGDYIQGWKEYEWRTKCPEYAGAYRLPPMPGNPPPWRGEPLNGKNLLLLAEQGIGDTIQFIRYARALADQNTRVNLYVRKGNVAEFLRSASGLSDVYDGSATIPAHDYYCPLLSLPRLCGTDTPTSIPASIPYLFAPSDRREHWRARLGELHDKIKIGLCWAGSPTNPDDLNRSCLLSVLAPLFDLPGISWISLQLGPAREQIHALRAPVQDWGDDLASYSDTAALMSELDLIISVDTSIAHASGALGLPVWIMLPHIPDFRWLLKREESPWYPTARLFRQDTVGDWSNVVAAMRSVLSRGEPLKMVIS